MKRKLEFQQISDNDDEDILFILNLLDFESLMKFSLINQKLRLFSLTKIYQRIQTYSDYEKLIFQNLYKMIDHCFMNLSFTIPYQKFMINDDQRIKFEKLLNKDELKTIWNKII